MTKNRWLPIWSLLLSGSALAGTTAAGTSSASESKSTRRWMVVPNVAFDTDDGLGFGIRGELAIDEDGYEPYHTGWVVHAFASTRGYHHHRVRFDRVGFGPEQRLRLTIHLAWRQWLNDGYWGIGNRTAREREYVKDFEEGDPGRRRYRYSLFQPFAHMTLRARIDGPWLAYGALTGKYSIVETYPGSLLALERPFGLDGGVTVQLQGGLLYDSRKPEGTPTSGVLAELGARIAPPLPTGAGTFGGVMGSVRAFWGITDRLVLAGRLMGEVMFGEIPFYEMVHWGGLFPVTGFGGFETIRGLSFGRFRAPGKAVLNTELRLSVFEHTLADEPFVWQLVPYADAGVVFLGDETRHGGGPEIHPGFGGGLRAIWQRDFVARIDAGAGLDPIVEPDGRTTNTWAFGFYIVFDHTF
ncbi:MAG: BamA/TamA family outer membrane protein [Deltaproteobacteria bacterium]|nr:BamA/TamA family outer membrane protein [Deltaproteobacteria bacterium]